MKTLGQFRNTVVAEVQGVQFWRVHQPVGALRQLGVRQVEGIQLGHCLDGKCPAQRVVRKVQVHQGPAICQDQRLALVERDLVTGQVEYLQLLGKHQRQWQTRESAMGDFQVAQVGKRPQKLIRNVLHAHGAQGQDRDVGKAHLRGQGRQMAQAADGLGKHEAPVVQCCLSLQFRHKTAPAVDQPLSELTPGGQF
ncbi:hypothetical protein D3C80_959230 [compost metagenome]